MPAWEPSVRDRVDGHKYGNMAKMKTTIEIPDPLFRKAKSRAAERGQTLRAFVAEALQAKLATDFAGRGSDEPRWMEGFGKLRHLRKETARVQVLVNEAFEVVEAEDRL